MQNNVVHRNNILAGSDKSQVVGDVSFLVALFSLLKFWISQLLNAFVCIYTGLNVQKCVLTGLNDRLYQIAGGWWRHLPGWALLPPLDCPTLNRPFDSDIVQRKFPFRQTFVQFIPYLWYNGENVLFVKLLLLGSTPYLWIRGVKKLLAFFSPWRHPFWTLWY